MAAAAAAADALAGLTRLLCLEIDMCRAPPEYFKGRAPRRPGGLAPQASSLLHQVAAAASSGMPALRQLEVTYPSFADPLLLSYCWHALERLSSLSASSPVQLLRRPAVAALEQFRSGALLTG